MPPHGAKGKEAERDGTAGELGQASAWGDSTTVLRASACRFSTTLAKLQFTQAIRSRLVAPGVPNGSPAVITIV